MKYRVFKIAAGVLLGMVAAIVTYKFQKSRKQAYAEHQKNEAEVLSACTSNAAKRIEFLIPDELITLCGISIHEYYLNSFSRSRFMCYIGADHHRVDIGFYCEETGKCLYQGMTCLDCAYFRDWEGHITDHQGKPVARAQIAEVPCLIGLADLYNHKR